MDKQNPSNLIISMECPVKNSKDNNETNMKKYCLDIF